MRNLYDQKLVPLPHNSNLQMGQGIQEWTK